MSRKKSENAHWSASRARWEAEPHCTFADIGETMGISKQAVAKHAKDYGWIKRLDREALAARAHRLADQHLAEQTPAAREIPAACAPSVVAENQKTIQLSPTTESPVATPEEAALLAEEAAVAARAELLTRHRREWSAARNLLYAAIKSKDYTEAKTAKTSAEAMKVVQEGERRAWGLDSGDEGKQTIVIERRAQ